MCEGLRKLHDKPIKHNDGWKGDTKYTGHPIWSKKAMQAFKENEFKINNEIKKSLRHEHVIPVDSFIREILAQDFCDENNGIIFIKDSIKKFSVVAIITVEEDKKLSREQVFGIFEEGFNIWARYEEIIDIFPISIDKK